MVLSNFPANKKSMIAKHANITYVSEGNMEWEEEYSIESQGLLRTFKVIVLVARIDSRLNSTT